MKIVTLFFAYVALLYFAKVGAMDNRSRFGFRRGDRDEYRNRHPEDGASDDGGRFGRKRKDRGRNFIEFPNPHPDLPAWTYHGHNHPTQIQNPDPNNHDLPQRRIMISKVVNHMASLCHLLVGELVPDLRIASCNGPFGFAIVDLYDSERLYSCLRPRYYHNESESCKQAGGLPEFVAYVMREGMVPHKLDGVLTTGGAKITFATTTGKFALPDMHALGHVRYIKYDPINPFNSINTAGDLFNFSYEGPR